MTRFFIDILMDSNESCEIEYSIINVCLFFTIAQY